MMKGYRFPKNHDKQEYLKTTDSDSYKSSRNSFSHIPRIYKMSRCAVRLYTLVGLKTSRDWYTITLPRNGTPATLIDPHPHLLQRPGQMGLRCCRILPGFGNDYWTSRKEAAAWLWIRGLTSCVSSHATSSGFRSC